MYLVLIQTSPSRKSVVMIQRTLIAKNGSIEENRTVPISESVNGTRSFQKDTTLLFRFKKKKIKNLCRDFQISNGQHTLQCLSLYV